MASAANPLDVMMERTSREFAKNLEKEKSSKVNAEREAAKPPKPVKTSFAPPPSLKPAALKKAQEAAQKQDDSKHIAKLRRKIRLYVKEFPEEDFARWPDVPMNADLETVRVRHEEIKASLSSTRAKETFVAIYQQLFAQSEYIVHGLGYNPMGWDIRGAGQFIANPKVIEALEPELTEGAIELGPYLQQAWYVRLGLKTAKVLQEYSMAKRFHEAQAAQLSAKQEQGLDAAMQSAERLPRAK